MPTEDSFPTLVPEPIRWTRDQQRRWAEELMAAFWRHEVQLAPPGGVTRTTMLELADELPLLHPDRDTRDLDDEFPEL